MSMDDKDEGQARFTGTAGVAQNTAMSEEAQQQPVTVAESAPLVFEQFANERMRTFLRLDFLYTEGRVHNEMQSQGGRLPAMGSLLDILARTAAEDVGIDAQ